MRTHIEWKNDTGSIDSRFKCALGINRKTGRLQWCPGCSCCKILIVIPITMLPIILVFILLTRLDRYTSAAAAVGGSSSSSSSSSQDDLYGSFENTIDSNNIIMNSVGDVRDPRCITVRYGMPETVEIEERDLLKDIRTSFIPPDFIVIPPNCVTQNNEYISSDDEQSSITQEELIYWDFLSRQRRESNLDETPNIDNININNNNNNNNRGIIAYDNNSDEDQSPLSMSFHFFWKSQGSENDIRTTQAEIMKKYMDTTTDPCDDFYQYACGNWAKLNPIPKDKAGYDTFEMLRESLDVVLRDLLTDKEKQNLSPPIDNNLEMPGETLKSNDPDDAVHEAIQAARLRKRIIKKRDVLDKILKRYKLSKLISRRRRQLIEKQTRSDDVDAEQKAKYLYQSCMNSELLEKRGIQPLLDLLQTLGGWPVLDDNWSEENFDWLNLTGQLRRYNNDIFIVEWVGPDIKNSDENVIQLDQTSLGLPTRDYFLHESNVKYLNAYKEFMTTVMNLLGANTDIAENTAKEVVDFETELAKITSSSEERANVSVLYKRMKISELCQIVPSIDWQRYLSIVQEREVNDSETIVIYAVDYMGYLVDLLSKTHPKTVANYLIWRFVRHRINNLDDRFQEGKQKFFHVLFGREQSPPRWKNCVGQVNSNMGMALGAMFVRRYFDENSKEDTLEMTQELQQAFREILNTTDWLDTTTKQLAELKVNSMSLKIGYPDFILYRDKLNEKYEGLEIDPEKYFENTLNVLQHVTRTEQQKLNEAVNKTVWQTAPAIVNAYYSRNKNQIMFPAGILQPPFYHRHFPRSLNYGGIGVVIGHELTHGFDDKGRLFDRDGNIHKWWSDYAINGFHERARCLISQYGNYTVPEVGITIDGESTQGENIADNGGIRQAFHAYQNWVDRNNSPNLEDSETLPGLNLTSKQLFFLNFAQVWCGAMRPEATRNKLKTAVHSPGKFRVIGTLSNSNDFAREYNCPSGSRMNPVNKCSVW